MLYQIQATGSCDVGAIKGVLVNLKKWGLEVSMIKYIKQSNLQKTVPEIGLHNDRALGRRHRQISSYQIQKRDCQCIRDSDAQTGGKKLIVSNTDELDIREAEVQVQVTLT